MFPHIKQQMQRAMFPYLPVMWPPTSHLSLRAMPSVAVEQGSACADDWRNRVGEASGRCHGKDTITKGSRTSERGHHWRHEREDIWVDLEFEIEIKKDENTLRRTGHKGKSHRMA